MHLVVVGRAQPPPPPGRAANTPPPRARPNSPPPNKFWQIAWGGCHISTGCSRPPPPPGQPAHLLSLYGKPPCRWFALARAFVAHRCMLLSVCTSARLHEVLCSTTALQVQDPQPSIDPSMSRNIAGWQHGAHCCTSSSTPCTASSTCTSPLCSPSPIVFNRALDSTEAKDELSERLDALIRQITFSLYHYVRRGLFERFAAVPHRPNPQTNGVGI